MSSTSCPPCSRVEAICWLYWHLRCSLHRWSKKFWLRGILSPQCGHWRSPNTGRHREESKHWISPVPLVPRSMAWSHSLHQLAATESVHAMYLRDWCFLADTRVFIQSCFRMSSFAFLTIALASAGSRRHCWRTGSVLISFWSHLHCSTRLILYTFSADKVLNNLEHMSSSTLSRSFERKLSFLNNIRALIEGRWRLMMGVRSLWYLPNLRIRLPISDWIFSSLLMSAPVSIHVSHP